MEDLTKQESKIRPTDFRLFLQSELLRRCRLNPHYSLRAFARHLNVSSSALSAMLNGKRVITFAMKKRFSTALGLGPDELRIFETLDDSRLEREYRDYQQIALDTYAIISDWYHYAILELARVKSFKPDPQWIAKALGLTKSEVNIAVERLQRVGLLQVTGEGKWVDTSNNGNASNIMPDATSIAAKKLQRQMLEKSLQALEETQPYLDDFRRESA